MEPALPKLPNHVPYRSGLLAEYRIGGRASSRPGVAAAFDELASRYLEHGAYILRLLTRPEAEHAELTGRLVDAGYLSRTDDGEFDITRQGLRRIEVACLAGLFHAEARSAAGSHDVPFGGDREPRPERRRPYQPGDRADRLDMHETIRNALLRSAGKPPVELTEDDIVVGEAEPTSRTTTVVLLDQSASMGRYGKFLRARDAALALRALVRRQFPGDTLIVVGFGTRATELGDLELLRARPKPVIPLRADGPRRAPLMLTGPDPLPPHFTNLHAGLRLARIVLRRVSADCARNVICVTDGEPTAHVENREIVVQYPPSEQSARATLEEARRCVRDGIGLSLVRLDENAGRTPATTHTSTGFVGRLSRLARGRVADCSLNGFGTAIVTSFVTGRRHPFGGPARRSSRGM